MINKIYLWKTCQQISEWDAIKRILQALLREQLLFLENIDNKFVITLNDENYLQIDQCSFSSLNYCDIKGNLYHHVKHKKPNRITKIVDLLIVIEKSLAIAINPQHWQQFTKEIINHVRNLTWSEYKKINRDKEIKRTAENHSLLCEWINTLAIPDKTLFFEQWVTDGHTYHPCSKTKWGLDLRSVLKFSPEFQPVIVIPVGAIHRDWAHVVTAENNLVYHQWFFEKFPELLPKWIFYLQQSKVKPEQYIPLPLHPWQMQREIYRRFKSLLTSKKLFLFKNLCLLAKPTLSFRTVVPSNPPHRPHIKLSVGVQTTSALRTISPASAENGPQITYILQKILNAENHFGNRLRVMGECVGIHVTGFDEQTAKHLSVLFRENANHHIRSNELAIVIAALFTTSPISQLPIFAELLSIANVQSLTEVKNYFERYTDIVLGSYLDLYLIYGIALEAHQQNTFAIFQKGFPTCTLARDFGGIRAHLPSLQEHNFPIKVYPNSNTFSNDRNEVRNKLLHTTYQYHLGEWVYQLAKFFKVPEKFFWQIIKTKTEERFDLIKNRIDLSLWKQEREIILNNDWPLKALLRMRLQNVSSEYIYLNLENPFKRNE